MRSWFPLTDYDFYAHVIAGTLFIAICDYCFADGFLIHKTMWSFVDGFFWAIVAYLTGHLIATPASAFIEHRVMGHWMGAPIQVQLGYKKPGMISAIFARIFAPREYREFPPGILSSIKLRAAEALQMKSEELQAEDIFQLAFHPARGNPDTAARLNSFQNQYGLCRNIAFVAFASAIMLCVVQWHSPSNQTGVLILISLIAMIGMFGRFLKFYGAYSADVLRTFGTKS